MDWNHFLNLLFLHLICILLIGIFLVKFLAYLIWGIKFILDINYFFY